MAEVEKPSPEWSVLQIAEWLKTNVEKSKSGYWKFKRNSYLLSDNCVSLLVSVCNQYIKEFKGNPKIEEGRKAQEEELSKLRPMIDSDIQTQLRKREAEINQLRRDLSSKQQEIDVLNEPRSWGWLTTRFPNFFKDGEAKIRQLEEEAKNAKGQVTHWSNQYRDLALKYDLLAVDQQKWNSERRALKDEIQKLQKEDNERLAKIVQLTEKKQAESLGDYEKRENYQIVTDYRTFCTQQALEVITEDIYGYLCQQKEELRDFAKRDFFLARTKATLSRVLLTRVYKVQIRQLRNKQPLFEFDAFFESHGKNLLSQLELSEELAEQLKKTAEKGFSLVTQLVKTNPPCHLTFADEGDMFDSEEHEIATGCPRVGIVKFTVVPGVLSGYQLLMKPVVFTEVKEAINQEMSST